MSCVGTLSVCIRSSGGVIRVSDYQLTVQDHDALPPLAAVALGTGDTSFKWQARAQM